MAVTKLTEKEWDQAFDQWIMVIKPKGEMTQFEYAKSLGVSAPWLSTKFSEIEISRITNNAKVKMAKVLEKSLDKVDEGLDELDGDEKVTAAGKVHASNESFKIMADRLGMAPAQMNMNVNTNIQMNVSLFGSEDKPNIETMFKGAVIDEEKNVD